MASEHSLSTESDLDRTDRLPILEGTLFDSDVEDDAVRMDSTAILPPNSFVSAQGGQTEFTRSGVDLPSLAESVRSVEERISRQNAEYEALTRSYERARDAEAATVLRANALAADLAAARTALESEQARSREIDKTLAERAAATEAARSRVEEALRESERFQTESRTLRDSLAARDATIVQVLHSLGERDAQLTALQLEHSKMLPVLEAKSKSSAQLEADLTAARAQAAAVAADLRSSQEAAAALAAELKRGESEINVTRSELGAVKTQATSYLEQLRSRDWRRGFDLNLFREMDAQVGAAHVGQSALESERDRLQSQVAKLEQKVSSQAEALEKLQSAAAANKTTLAQQANDLKRAEQTRAQLTTQLATADAEVARLNSELAARERSLAEARAAGSSDAKRVTELLAAAEQSKAQHEERLEQLQAEHAALIERQSAKHLAEVEQLSTEHAARAAATQAEQGAIIGKLWTEAEAHEQEMAVLVAHLAEARRPVDAIEAEVRRLTEELAAKTAGFDEYAEENRKLQASLDRTRGALEEREFLIRRLERSESNNANVLGRIQTSIERLGAVQSPTATNTGSNTAAGATPVPDWSAEMIRIDGERPITYPLSKRTRIGRAPGCELQIESTSVSRHHALVLVGPRDSIIEDLNSTNGVFVNGRKVTRQLLSDGDAVTIGETQFRYSARPAVRPTDSHPGDSRILEPAASEPKLVEAPAPVSAPAAVKLSGPKSTGF
jgi:hypothetical protein